MITDKTYKDKILKKIEELKSDQEYYRHMIDSWVRIAEENSYNVRTYEGMGFVYCPDGTVPDLVQGSIRRCDGVIHGLQLAIDELEKEL